MGKVSRNDPHRNRHHPAEDAAGEMIERREQETAALRAKVERMTKRLLLILEEPENTMSNSKALREMVRQARLALEESK